jgi:general secretion pathway protein F
MAVYDYKGLDRNGKTTAGMIDADNPRLARARLRKGGIFPTAVSLRDAVAEVSLFPGRMSLAQTAVLTRQWATLLGAGIPLIEAVTTLIEQTEGETARKTCLDIRERIREGMTLAAALDRHPRIFSPLYRQMVRAGEAGGQIEQVMLRLADHLENQARLGDRILSILAYPALMLLVSLLILLFLLTFVVPKVVVIFTDLRHALPLPTVILIGLSDFFIHYGWLLGLLSIVAVFLLRRHIAKPRGRAQYDRLILTLPLIGGVVRRIAISRCTRTLATLLASGVPILEALSIARQVVGNRVMEEVLQQANLNIREGESISDPLKRSGLFPPMVIQMIATGEKSGQLERMLQKVSESYDNEVETTVTRVTALLSPLMILGMGVIVFFIVTAILLPIFEISQAVR